MSDICRPKSSVALFQQATALEPRTSSPPRGSYPDRKVDVLSAWLTVENRRELGLRHVSRRGAVGNKVKLVGTFEPVRAVLHQRCRPIFVFPALLRNGDIFRPKRGHWFIIVSEKGCSKRLFSASDRVNTLFWLRLHRIKERTQTPDV